MRTRNAVVAATAALALALGASLLGGVAAGADPGPTAPVITSPVGDSTVENQNPTFAGTADAGTAVTVYDSTHEIALCSVPAESNDGTWSCAPSTALDYRQYTVIASSLAVEASPLDSSPVTFTVAPVPAVTLDAHDPIYTTSAALSLSGTTNRGISSALLTFGDGSTAACAVSTGEGTWSCSYSSDGDLPAGAGILAFTVLDSATVPTVPFTVLDDTATPGTDYAFSPGALTVTASPTTPATLVSTQVSSLGESGDFRTGCPDLVESSTDFPGATPGPVVCPFTELYPGWWKVSSYQDVGDGQTRAVAEVDRAFFVPDAPVIGTVSGDAANVLTVSGDVGTLEQYPDDEDHDDDIEDYRASAGDVVHVYNGGDELCSAVVQDGGTWSCTTANALPGGTYSIRAAAEDHGGPCECDPAYLPGGISALSVVSPEVAGFGITLPTLGTGGTTTAGPDPTPGPTPTPAPSLPAWTFDLKGLNLGNVHPGDRFTITGSGLPAGAVITIELHSTPITLGAVTVGAGGTFSLTGTIPNNVEPGEHHIVATLTGPGVAPSTAEKAITITAETSSATSSGAGASSTAEGGPASHSADATHEAVAPNILTDSLNPIAEVLGDPGRIPAAFAAGLVLLLFAIMPAHLLNATIGEQYERLARRLPSLRRQPKWYGAAKAAFTRAPALGGLVLTAVTAFLFAFADPGFGINLHSLRLVLALAAALFVVTYLANAITGAIMRRAWKVDVAVSIRPLGLVLTVVGVALSRILDFSPGFLVGLAIGLTIANSSASRQAWKAVLIRASVIIVFGIGAWLVYSSIAPGVHHEPSFWGELVLELFVAIATEGVVMLLIELLPFHLLEGERLYHRSKLLWGAAYTVLLVVFLLAVVPWEGNWRELGESFWPWFTVVAVFGAVCVGIYLYFRFLSPGHGEEGGEPEAADEHDRIAVGDD